MTSTTQTAPEATGSSRGPTGQFATFTLDGLTFGVEVLKVQEVIRYQAMTRVPLAHRTVRGLINLRGQIVTAIDMRRRCGISDRVDGAPPMNVVVRTRDGVVSMLVDEIGDVIEPNAADAEPVPDTITGAVRALVSGIYKLQGHLLLALDVERAVAVDVDHAAEY